MRHARQHLQQPYHTLSAPRRKQVSTATEHEQTPKQHQDQEQDQSQEQDQPHDQTPSPRLEQDQEQDQRYDQPNNSLLLSKTNPPDIFGTTI